MIIVADSSPLISFARIDKLNLLNDIFKEIYISPAVFDEITHINKPYSQVLKEFSKDKIKSVKNALAVSLLMNDLDKGESESIVLAFENNIKRILIDEQRGRKIAKLNGLTPVGTLGVLLRAKEIGLINQIKPLMNILIDEKFRISNLLYNEVLIKADEI